MFFVLLVYSVLYIPFSLRKLRTLKKRIFEKLIWVLYITFCFLHLWISISFLYAIAFNKITGVSYTSMDVVIVAIGSMVPVLFLTMAFVFFEGKSEAKDRA